MAGSVIGAQMFTLREHTKTPADIASTLKRLREMGYEAIQASAMGPIEPEELGKILKNEGLTCAATHVSVDLMRDVNRCVEYHEMLGCKYPAVGGAGEVRKAETNQAVTEFAQAYSQIAKPLAEKGLRIGYHNHSWELTRFEGAKTTVLQQMFDQFDPSIWFEIDTYWIAHGGGDPAAWIEKFTGRANCIHVKDMQVTPAQEHKMCEVGEGNLNWPAILQAARNAGVEWFLVERDNGDLDPFESLKISLDNLRSMGLP